MATRLSRQHLQSIIEALQALERGLVPGQPLERVLLPEGVYIQRPEGTDVLSVIITHPVCLTVRLGRACQLSIVDDYSTDTDTQGNIVTAITGCKLTSNQTLKRGWRYCLCNATESKSTMRVEFDDQIHFVGNGVIPPGGALAIEVLEEIPQGANPTGEKRRLAIAYHIWRVDQDGQEDQCHGAGGGTDLHCEDP